MKPYNTILTIVATAIFFTGGCVTTNSTLLQVSGTPGAQFTARYRAGTLSGDITTTLRNERPATAVEVSGRGGEFTCDIAKKDRSTRLTAVVVQGGKSVFTADAPVGTQGVRISHSGSGWQQESY
jgi:hypothetical protein